MADKFLSDEEMEQIKEEIKMTRLGQMLFEDGVEKGISLGISQGAETARLEAARNLIGLLQPEQIADRIGLPLEKVMEIIDGQE